MPSTRRLAFDPTTDQEPQPVHDRRPGPSAATRAAALAGALALALTGLVALPPASAAPALARAAVVGGTTISGWSTASATVPTGSAPAVRIRVTSAHIGTRTVLLQRRREGTVIWSTITRVSTSASGYATLRLGTPAGHWQFKVFVPATRTASFAQTGVRVLTGVSGVPSSAMAAQMLAAVNAARAVPRRCGGIYYPAVRPLAYNTALERAAVGHAVDMATHNYFSHDGRTGSKPTSRAQAAGYHGVAGENIAAGYPSVSAVMAGWLASPGHCANIMSGSYQDLGVGSAYSAKSTYGSYWVQDFGIRT